MYKIKKDDTVKIISGNYKGQTGRVLRLIGLNNRALVEGVNKVKKHMRPSQENPQGGIVEKEMSIHISNLMLVEKNTPTKVGFKFGKDGVSELENRLKLTSALSITNMHMFNENGRMQKFKSISEIINQWYEFRGGIYTKRREYMLNKLKKELDIIKYKVSFIEEIINDTLEIKNVKKQIIIDQLTDKSYPKFSTKDDGIASYDYLMSMDLYKLTHEEIEELKKKKELKQSEFDKLSDTTATDLWLTDIDNFITEYTKLLKIYEKEHMAKEITKKTKVKKRLKIKK